MEEGENPVAVQQRAALAAVHDTAPPFIVLLGGGMAAGKSNVVATLPTAGCVVVEADNFKETDVVYRELNRSGRQSTALLLQDALHSTISSS